MAIPPPPPYPDKVMTFFLVSLFRLKKSSFFRKAFFFWGGGGGRVGSPQNVSAPLRKPKALSAPSPHLNNRSYATAFPAPGKRLVMWVLKYFIYPIHFALLKMFHNLPFFSFFYIAFYYLYHTILNLRKIKNQVTAKKKNKKKKNDFFFSSSKTADTEDYSTHLFEITPPPPPGCLERVR